MSFRFHTLAFMSLFGLLGLSLSPELSSTTAQGQTIQDRTNAAIKLYQLGTQQYAEGQLTEALTTFQQALVIAREVKNRAGEATLLNDIGLTYDSLGQYTKALDYYQQALEIRKAIGDRLGEGITLNNIGAVYDNLGQYAKTLDYYQQALQIIKAAGDRASEGTSLNNIGLVYDNLGQYSKALDYYQQALSIRKAVRDRIGEGQTLSNIGAVYESLNQYPKALDYYQQSLAIIKAVGDRTSEGTTLNNIGLAYDSLTQYPKALEYYQQALTIRKEIGDRAGEGQTINNIGAVYNRLGQYPQALDHYQQALVISKEVGDRAGEVTILNNIGYLLAEQSQSTLAIVFYKQSVKISESIRKDIRNLDKGDRQSYTITVAESYRDLADLLLKQDRVMEALQILDLLKVQELEDYLKNIKGSDRSAQGVRMLAPEQAISSQLLAIKFENISTINRQLTERIQQISASEINKVPDYLQQIPQGTALLYPLILDDALELIFFTPNALPIRRSVKISKDQLQSLIVDFKTGLQDNGSEDVKLSAAKLYDVLIKPIETELIQSNTNTILYAPDAQLRYIPLAALYDGKQWLAEKYRISNLIAYTLTNFSVSPKSPPRVLAAAFGGKDGETKFGQNALPATIQEVQAIAKSFSNSVTFLENTFSRQAIESQFKNYNILHLATHAEFNVGTPDKSFIIFGNGDKILLNEITDWQVPNLELIILSACQTGLGKLGDGVEILGFGYQVQKAGAKQVIASLWSVNDQGTQALMEVFYGELKKSNVKPTEALHRAQMSLIKSPNYNHPSYWAAFFAIGNGS